MRKLVILVGDVRENLSNYYFTLRWSSSLSISKNPSRTSLKMA